MTNYNFQQLMLASFIIDRLSIAKDWDNLLSAANAHSKINLIAIEVIKELNI